MNLLNLGANQEICSADLTDLSDAGPTTRLEDRLRARPRINENSP